MSDPVREPGSKWSLVDERAVTRRSFLGYVGAGAAAAAVAGSLAGCGGDGAEAQTTPEEKRRNEARGVRRDAAEIAYDRPLPEHPNNGDEGRYENKIGNYSKALPHNGLGEADPDAYDKLLNAMSRGDAADFEAVPIGGTVKLANPQCGLAFELEGPDSHALAQPPAPRFDSAETAGEMVELYWMALTRDVHFADYDSDPLVAAACDDLSILSDFRGPKQNSRVTPATVFRGITPGDLAGPVLSQFLLKDFSYGSLPVSQRQRTLVPDVDYLTDFATWLAIQNGAAPTASLQLDPTPRYLRTLRDLARYVQVDTPYEAYLNALLILLAMKVPVAVDSLYRTSRNQGPFSTFGGPHIFGLVAEVANRALKAVWYQKWFVHRRLRPEEYAGRVEVHVAGEATYPLHADVLSSDALSRVQDTYGTGLLPMAYPDGCPTHPAYGAGHNAIAGACVTILKAWFDERFPIPDPVLASADGTTLDAYTGADAGQLTVGGELNKLAANIAAGRNAGGVHWRSDYTESITLGEAVAIGVLEEQNITFHEACSFTFTKFDGTAITI